MNNSEATIRFEEFLKSIGGIENGMYLNRPPIVVRYFFSVGDGWLPMIQELIEKLILLGWDKKICQVKEKFGGLRFYVVNNTKEISDLIKEYEVKSFKICDVCGCDICKTSSVNGWIYSRCEKHRPEELTSCLQSKDN
jgi:hypothetical protein